MAYTPPPDLTITIAGRDRYWVAEGIIDQAILVERQAEAKRKKSPGRARDLKLAAELRDLARKILP